MAYATLSYPKRRTRTIQLAKLMRTTRRFLRTHSDWTSGMTKAYTDLIEAYDAEYTVRYASLPAAGRAGCNR